VLTREGLEPKTRMRYFDVRDLLDPALSAPPSTPTGPPVYVAPR
jgi:hypothetical protein